MVALGLAALSRRGCPTVWPSRMLRWILAAGALVALGLYRQDGALLAVAVALAAAAVYVTLASHSALVLYGPADGAAPIAVALKRFGVRYERTDWTGRGDRFAIDRPAATVTSRALPSGPLRARWVTVGADEWTPKLRLLEGVLHKLLSNRNEGRQPGDVSG